MKMEKFYLSTPLFSVVKNYNFDIYSHIFSDGRLTCKLYGAKELISEQNCSMVDREKRTYRAKWCAAIEFPFENSKNTHPFAK